MIDCFTLSLFRFCFYDHGVAVKTSEELSGKYAHKQFLVH